ncbi:DNA-3-methyladenine glycosylase I [Carnobacterium viridans]|uniref:DNA-3-methyladenine glycosylase I n=1 Tax=Carnobacterium viridans TaxID=174587 RepID=A0A1H1B7L3_9LACT|nr:DNA-3-methyladenine glycosylase I [Carnobacterium viridans]UDE95897.1 DNA-3-methyladenine glycosylase I [Carnobacterium viridans]SDQ47882.1 DNA-3-methyladenine glycosylase I [Carnobacterium viridans]
MERCSWATSDLMKKYHDEEWGKPLHDDQALFELLILETMQAGLSWSTILDKRENYREALDGFEPEKISHYDQKKIEELLSNSGIIRNKLKIASIIKNAVAFLKVKQEFSSFNQYIWSFVEGEPIVNHFNNFEKPPVKTELSSNLSKDMKKRGFSFVGPITCYAFMEAAGLVNDHSDNCSFK